MPISVLLGTATSAFVTCIAGAVGAWAAPYGIRTFMLPPTELGALLGSIQLPAILAVVLGGWFADKWKVRDARAPVGMCLVSVAGTVPALLLMTLSTHFAGFLTGYALVCFACALSTGATAAMIQDLVLPRMRGAAAAVYSLCAVFISIGTGPYLVGKTSSLTGSLALGLLGLLALVPITLALMWCTARRLAAETPQRRIARAQLAGEREQASSQPIEASATLLP